MGKMKEKYLMELENRLGYLLKNGVIDEVMAEWLMVDATYEEARKFLDDFEAKGEAQAEMQMEDQAMEEHYENKKHNSDKSN